MASPSAADRLPEDRPPYRRKLHAIAAAALLASALSYATAFPSILARRAHTVAQGRPYCIVIPGTDPAAFSGWTVSADQRLQKIHDFQELSLADILARRLSGRTAQFRYTRPIHLGIVVDDKAYHWSFTWEAFVENDSYVDFRRDFNRNPGFPPECAIPR